MTERQKKRMEELVQEHIAPLYAMPISSDLITETYRKAYTAAMLECAPLVEALKSIADPNNGTQQHTTDKQVAREALRAFEGDET